MSENKILAAQAALKVLESWGVKEFYGIPGGSTGSMMEAAMREKDNINFIRVRHEEVGAMAASMHAKYTGHIGVAMGSAGPGGTHLLNGLYDAREDHVPVLAIIGQMPHLNLNMDAFQEMNEAPIYADVADYVAQISYAEQIPHVFDEAIRRAYQNRGVSVVILPTDFGMEEIPADGWYSSAHSFRKYPNPTLNEADLDAAVEVLKEAKRPLIYAGIGTRGSGKDIVALSKKIKVPVMITGINADNFDDSYEAFLGSAGRVARKPAVEALQEADVVLFMGANYPFAETYHVFDEKRMIYVNLNAAHLGKRGDAEVSILGDAGDVARALLEKVDEVEPTSWWNANVANVKNWKEYVNKIETRTEGDLEAPQAYHYINKYMTKDAIFSIDVGNTTIHSARHLHMTEDNLWRTSPLFATMGIGLPGAIAAKLAFPDRQVWSLSGDGALSMVAQDLATLAYYKLNTINVVFTNKQFGFIKGEQEDLNIGFFGVDFDDTDFAKVAEGFNVKGLTVDKVEDLDATFKKAVEISNSGEPVLIDVKISGNRPFVSEFIQLDEETFGKERVDAYKKRYYAEDLKPLKDFLKAEGL